jgi:trigger factor
VSGSGLIYRVLTAPTPKIPEIEAPSIEGLRVSVSRPRPITEEDLMARLAQLRRAAAERTPRPLGSLVQEGDELLLDVVAYCNGKLVPFSAQEGLQVRLDEEGLRDPVMAALVQVASGSRGMVTAKLPEDYSYAPLRGQVATYAVHVHAVWAIRELPADSPELIERLGLGKNIHETMRALHQKLLDERALGVEVGVGQAILEELVRRAKVEVSQRLFEKEMLERWMQREGRFLQKSGIAGEDFDAAFQAWLDDPEYSGEVKRMLKNAIVLRAIVKKHDLKVDENKLQRAYDALGRELSGGRPPRPDEPAPDPMMRAQAFNAFVTLGAIQYLRERTQVEYKD